MDGIRSRRAVLTLSGRLQELIVWEIRPLVLGTVGWLSAWKVGSPMYERASTLFLFIHRHLH